MANSQSLAVGLAVGIPSFLIITVTLLLWYRNQRKQLREDNLNKEIDLELRDDQSFNQFQEELHRKKQFMKPIGGAGENPLDLDNDQNKSYSTTTQIESSSNNEKLFNGSSSISSTSDNTNIIINNQTGTTSSSSPPPQPQPLHPPTPHHQQTTLPTPNTPPSFYHPHQRPQTPNKIHQKSPSAYDFYETFIPVLPSTNNQYNSSSQTDITSATPNPNHTTTTTPPSFQRPTSIRHSSSLLDQQSANSSSNASFIQPPMSQSQPPSTLENFAKQLNSPTFFEKLPSRAAPPQLSLQRQLQKSNNNSSSDLLVNKLVGDEAAAINDHYTYEPDSHPSSQSQPIQPQEAQEGQTLATIIRQKSLRSHNLTNESNGHESRH